MVGDHTIAFHCGYNHDSIGIELCDMPSQDKTRWDDQPHRDMEVRWPLTSSRVSASPTTSRSAT
jgi:hypothetical protein